MSLRMSEERARRIIRALGWRMSDFRRELNRVTRMRYRSGGVWNWFDEGKRDIPRGAAIFLRMSLRLAIERRRRGPSCGGSADRLA